MEDKCFGNSFKKIINKRYCDSIGVQENVFVDT